jgi:hypothetical protein
MAMRWRRSRGEHAGMAAMATAFVLAVLASGTAWAAAPTPERILDVPSSAPSAARQMPDVEQAQDANDPNSAGDAEDADAEEETEAGGIRFGQSTGILTLALLLVTVCLAGFQRMRPQAMRDWHKVTGSLALLAGIVHALAMLLG